MRIIFMGTPDFAVASLQKLIENEHQVVAVITAPDRPAGRGRKIQFSAIKEFALSKDLPILQPTNLKDEAFIKELASYKADLQIVVAFRMLPQVVWQMPPKGTFNLHASLLPNYRGAAPINWAIINGETKTGVSTFFINEKIDTGAIIEREELNIGENETAGELHDRLMKVGAKLLEHSTCLIRDGIAKALPQQNDASTKEAPKIFKETCSIDFSKDANQAHNLIRGLSPYPAAQAVLNNNGDNYKLKIFETRLSEPKPDLKAGDIYTDNKTFLNVKCADTTLSIQSLQLAGKKRVAIKEFLNGSKLENNAKMVLFNKD